MPELKLTGDDRFAEGVCVYADNVPEDPDNRRLVIPVHFGNETNFRMAIVDTGSQWCILDPRHAKQLEESVTLKIREKKKLP